MALRAPIAVVNERSLPPIADSLDEVSAATALQQFVQLIRSVQKIRSDVALASAIPLGALPLTNDGLGFAALAETHGGALKEQWRYLQGRRNVAPFAAGDELQLPGLDRQYSIGGEPCEGLGIASHARQLGVSFRTDPLWDAAELPIDLSELIENPETGEVEQATQMVVVRHASLEDHVATHREFIADLALPEPFSGGDLWSDRAERYPRLQWLPHVEAQLRSLGHGNPAVAQVHNRLDELSRAAAAWDPSAAAFPAWHSKVNPEGEVRKKYCMFVDVDGETRCFDQHAFFTPGHGRVHFRLVAEGSAGYLRVAHVGLKLGV